MIKLFVLAPSLSFVISAAWALNDWNKPCLQGVCAYDIAAGSNSIPATIQVSGSPNAISDITPAAGWEILNCSSDASSQTIRLVCAGNESNCNHLFQNGAQHTLVRLPEDCGKGPFAVVSNITTARNQSLPSHLASRLTRRDGTTPMVQSLTFSTDFTQASTPHGPVSYTIIGSSIPGAVNASVSPTPRRYRRFGRRHGIRDVIADFSIGGILGGITSFDKNVSTTIPTISKSESATLLDKTLSCTANEEVTVNIGVDASASVQATFGVVAQGQIVPPEVKQFGLYAALSADLDGTLNIDANVLGQLDSGSIQLISVGIPGLDVDGIISIGPTFTINAEATATLDIDIDMKVDLSYHINNLELFFPSSQGSSSASLSQPSSPLQLSVSPNVTSEATFAAHIIPSLNFGISVPDVATATIFLDLDADATLDLSLNAFASGSVSSNGEAGASAEVDGCVELDAGFSANAGVEGSFFGLFDASDQFTIYSNQWDLFKKCFTETVSTTKAATTTSTTTKSSTTSSTPTATSTPSPTTHISTVSSSSSSLPIANTSPASRIVVGSSSPLPTTIASSSTPASSLSTSATRTSASVCSTTAIKKRSIGRHVKRSGISCPSSNIPAASPLVNST